MDKVKLRAEFMEAQKREIAGLPPLVDHTPIKRQHPVRVNPPEVFWGVRVPGAVIHYVTSRRDVVDSLASQHGYQIVRLVEVKTK